jgi:hypothetical protein
MSRSPLLFRIRSIREETQMDLDRITHPLRLARGSHQPGSGKGCAMNVISYINGDTHITDFPDCSARPLAAFVQLCNDLLAGPDGYLSPKNSLLALELGFQTVGTADIADSVIHAWVAELLSSPAWGVVRCAKKAAAKAVFDIAELHRRAAAGDTPSIADWDAADRAARAVYRFYRAGGGTLRLGGLDAVRAAYQSTALVDTDHRATLDVVTGYALRAHTLATGGTTATPIVKLTRHAIRSWRTLAGLDNQSDANWTSVDSAWQLIGAPAYTARQPASAFRWLRRKAGTASQAPGRRSRYAHRFHS